jgi:hypothetical protein
MPYRRLPNTDEARIKSLKRAIQNEEENNIHNLVFSLQTQENAKKFLSIFETARFNYKQALQEQVKASKNYQPLAKQARLYISHFIQVLNLSVIRDEIKANVKLLYGLKPDNFSIPDISSDSALINWGDKIISGEEKRLSSGGTPIYNPTIAKVRVHYDTFRDAFYSQKMYQQTTTHMLESLASLRMEGDAIIVDLWNQIEEKFKDIHPAERLEKCKSYGIIYYYRKSEKRDEMD